MKIYGWTDILKVGDKVRVLNTNHISKISEVIKVPHCTIYRLEEKQWELNWHFRVKLELLEK